MANCTQGNSGKNKSKVAPNVELQDRVIEDRCTASVDPCWLQCVVEPQDDREPKQTTTRVRKWHGVLQKEVAAGCRRAESYRRDFLTALLNELQELNALVTSTIDLPSLPAFHIDALVSSVYLGRG